MHRGQGLLHRRNHCRADLVDVEHPSFVLLYAFSVDSDIQLGNYARQVVWIFLLYKHRLTQIIEGEHTLGQVLLVLLLRADFLVGRLASGLALLQLLQGFDALQGFSLLFALELGLKFLLAIHIVSQESFLSVWLFLGCERFQFLRLRVKIDDFFLFI